MKKLLLILCFLLVAPVCMGEMKYYTLEWDANTENDLSGYKIYVGTESRVYGDPIIPTENPLATVYQGEINVPDDAESDYYWAVTAYDTSGLESDYSNEVTKHFDTRVAPAPPQNLRWFERLVRWIKTHWRFWS